MSAEICEDDDWQLGHIWQVTSKFLGNFHSYHLCLDLPSDHVRVRFVWLYTAHNQVFWLRLTSIYQMTSVVQAGQQHQ